MRDSLRERSTLILGALCVALVLPATAADVGRALPDRYVRGGLDGTPVVVDHPVDGRTWATWAYRNGAEYDIAVSVRDEDGLWSEPRMFGAADGADQVDPDLVFDASGTAYLTFANRDTGEVRVAVLAGGLPGWLGPRTVAVVDTLAAEPAVRVVGDRLVLAFRTADGIELLDFQTVRSVGPIGLDGIQEGPDVIDPLGREMDTGDSRSGESAGTSDGTTWRNRPGTSPGAEIRSFRSRARDSGEP